MHEGAVCTEIIDIVSRAAAANDIRKVDEIILSVGPYSCLNPGQLNFYFEVAREGTCMAQASNSPLDKVLIKGLFLQAFSGQIL